MDTVGVLFDPYRAVVLNERIEPLVEEIRSLIRDGYIPTVRVVLCNNGARWTAQADAWIDDAKQRYGEQVEFLHFNHDAIVNSLKRGDRIDATVALSGQAIVEDMNYLRVLVGRVAVGEIARLFAEHGDRLLQRNIRRYLGHVNRVNSDIRATLLDRERSDKFYFYNNGVTMVCDRFDYNALQRADYQVRMSNMQVINGGQTCKTIQQTLSVDGAPGVEDAYVMLRIYQLPDDAADVVQEITKGHEQPEPRRLARSALQRRMAKDAGARNTGVGFRIQAPSRGGWNRSGGGDQRHGRGGRSCDMAGKAASGEVPSSGALRQVVRNDLQGPQCSPGSDRDSHLQNG